MKFSRSSSNSCIVIVGCIIFGSDQEVAGVMRAVRRCNATGAFSWIGSDGWSARGLVSNGNEPEVEGTLSVQPQANSVKGFEEYFLNLTVENNRRNPWFVGKRTAEGREWEQNLVNSNFAICMRVCCICPSLVVIREVFGDFILSTYRQTFNMIF